MKRHLRWVLLLTGVCFGSLISNFSPNAAEPPSRWTPELMARYERVSGTAVSPDGSLVAYTVWKPLMEGDKSEYLTHIRLVSADGKINRQVTRGERSCFSPQFSPDGKYLSFISGRGSGGRHQIWLLPLEGGDAEQATAAPMNITSHAWSPDGARIAFTMTDPETPREEKNRREKRDMSVVGGDIKYSHLYTVDVEPGLTGVRNVRGLTAGAFHLNGFDWSPDGETIVFSCQATPSPDDWKTSALYTVSADSGAVGLLVDMAGSDVHPGCSPDGEWVAFLSDSGEPKWGMYYYYDLWIVPAGGGTPRKLTSDLLCAQGGMIGWSSDSREVYVRGVDRTSNRVFAVPISGGAPRSLTPGAGTASDASLGGKGAALAYVHQDSETPAEVYLVNPRSGIPRKLTDVHTDYPRLPLGKTEVITWKSRDGLEIEGLLTYPVGYEKGKRYPLVLNVHGGPMGSFSETFTAAGGIYPIQAFAQEGYAFLRPNPRGSNGYGREFVLANYNDWGYGDYEDLMSGVDRVIAMGTAHPDSLCVMGWSYGGYMTSMIIARTNRFKAASVGAGVTNLMSFTGTADIPSFIPDYFSGEYWDNPEAYRKHSPMFNIKGAATPTLILHGEQDRRVPLSQGQELYNALKRQECPVEMVIYPRMAHSPSEPKFMEDLGRRSLDWCNTHLRDR